MNRGGRRRGMVANDDFRPRNSQSLTHFGKSGFGGPSSIWRVARETRRRFSIRYVCNKII